MSTYLETMIDTVDPPVRNLVRAMNELPDIETFSSDRPTVGVNNYA